MQGQAKEGDMKDGSQSKGKVKNGQRAEVRALRLRISSLQGRVVEESRRRTEEAKVACGSSSPLSLAPMQISHIHIRLLTNTKPEKCAV